MPGVPLLSEITTVTLDAEVYPAPALVITTCVICPPDAIALPTARVVQPVPSPIVTVTLDALL